MVSTPASRAASHGANFRTVLYDQAAGESCPIFPGQPKKLHWSTPDPAKVEWSEADAAFDKVFFMLKQNVEELTNGRLLLTRTPVVS